MAVSVVDLPPIVVYDADVRRPNSFWVEGQQVLWTNELVQAQFCTKPDVWPLILVTGHIGDWTQVDNMPSPFEHSRCLVVRDGFDENDNLQFRTCSLAIARHVNNTHPETYRFISAQQTSNVVRIRGSFSGEHTEDLRFELGNGLAILSSQRAFCQYSFCMDALSFGNLTSQDVEVIYIVPMPYLVGKAFNQALASRPAHLRLLFCNSQHPEGAGFSYTTFAMRCALEHAQGLESDRYRWVYVPPS